MKLVRLVGTAALLVMSAAVPAAATAPSGPPRASDARTAGCTILGTERPDRLVGTRHRDVICGLGGADVVTGRGGEDVILGGGGADRIEGGAGDDHILGGNAADDVSGGPGRDDLAGGAGGDFLDGGPQADDVDGGAGVNACTTDPADTANRCTYDREAPVVTELEIVDREVLVAGTQQYVTVRLHATDDTGIESVAVQGKAGSGRVIGESGRLVSGTRRDGWWLAKVGADQTVRSGTYELTAIAFDTHSRITRRTFPEAAIPVRNDNPDHDGPEVTVLSPGPGTLVDTRDSRANVAITMHVTDAVAGVRSEGGVGITVWSPDFRQGMLVYARLTSGTMRDGTWRGVVSLPAGSVQGGWTFSVAAADEVGNWSRYLERQQYGSELAGGRDAAELHLLPDGWGVLNVLGRGRETAAPTVRQAALAKTQVDTLSSATSVGLSVSAADVGTGIAGIYATLVPVDPDSSYELAASGFRLKSGSPLIGTWTGEFTVPQGTPPGDYYLSLLIWDEDQNYARYVSATAPAGSSEQPPLEGATVLTITDSSG